MNESNFKGKIESNKVVVKELFSDFWFRVPEYQRSFVWGQDEISELLEDISFATKNKVDSEYFLGPLVLQKKVVSTNENSNNIYYTEYDILDGQQRLTTILLLLAVVRDLTSDNQLKYICNKYIYQEENKFENIPERLRLDYKIRDNVEEFFHSFVKKPYGTKDIDILKDKIFISNVSISNMSKAIIQMHNYFSNFDSAQLNKFAKYLFNNVLLIYVSSENLDDAFRLFTILNDRGIPLSNSDILKAANLGVLKSNSEKEKYAKFWEDAEGEFGRDDFDRFLSHIRTILVKDKARENLLKEFEEKIYKNNLLKKGKESLEFIKKYKEYYERLLWFNNLPLQLNNKYKNLIIIMNEGLPSTDWIPPILLYYDKFKNENLLEFLKKLDNKFSSDWIVQLTPTFRINNMNKILEKIESASSSEEVINNKEIFNIDNENLFRILNGDVYGRRFAKYILLKLEYLYKDHSSQFNTFKYISVEHVLPQNPSKNGKWFSLFTEEEREQWTHKFGNLILLSRRKNSQLNNKDFEEKKKLYFSGNIDSFPNSLRVMQYKELTLDVLKNRHEEIIDKLKNIYK